MKSDKKALLPEATDDANIASISTENVLAEHNAEVNRELHSIYDDVDTERTNMHRLTRVQRSFGKKLLVGAIFFFAFLAAISWAGFFLFSGDSKFSGEGVILNIDGPLAVKSGELVTYQISWENGEKDPLGTANLELRLPTEFKVIQTEPPAEKNVWSLGSVSAGKRGSVAISGVYVAPLGRQLDLQAILTYRPADFNSAFQKVATRAIGVTGSVLEMLIVGPIKVMPGDKATVKFSFINNSDQDFTNVKLQLRYPPSGFIPESAEPKAEDERFTSWLIGSVPAHSENHVVLIGTFAAETQGALDIAAQIGFTDDRGEFQLQQESNWSTEVVNGQLMTALILNGKSGDQPTNFGDRLRYSISWHNSGEAELEDVVLTAVLETQPATAELLQWNQIKDAQQGIVDGNRITWSGKQVTALKSIGPGQEGTIDFELPLVAIPPENAEGFRITAWTETVIATIDNEPTNRLTKTTPFAAVLLSNTTVAASARYFTADGVPVGSGPLPPQVNQATTYRVFWTIENSLHELSDLKMSARLPENVAYTGKSGADAGEVRFDAADGKVLWSLNRLPIAVKKLTVWFDVAITPTIEQVGRTPTLVDATIMEAKDRQTNFDIILSAAPLSTTLEDDEQAVGRGRVVAAP